MTTVAPVQTNIPSTKSTSTTANEKAADSKQVQQVDIPHAEIDSFVSQQKIPEEQKDALKATLKKATENIIKTTQELGLTLKVFLEKAIEGESHIRQKFEEVLKSPEKMKVHVDKQIEQSRKQLTELKASKLISDDDLQQAEKQLAEMSAKPEIVVDMMKQFMPTSNIIPDWLKHWLAKLNSTESKT